MFEIRKAGIKGFGVFAAHRIARGTRILFDRPLLWINETDNSDILAASRRLSRNELQTLLQLSINESKRYSVLSLWDAAYKSLRSWAVSDESWSRLTLSGIKRDRTIFAAFYNNNFAIYGPQPGELKETCSHRAVFPTVARINHSCVPNSQGNFNTNLDGGSFTIHALRQIDKDEEITISYLHNELGLRSERQGWLKDVYGFECQCEICCAGQRSVLSQDRRAKLRSEVERMYKEQGLPTDTTSETGSRNGELLRLVIKAYEEEGLAGRELASLYVAAARLTADSTQSGHSSDLETRSLELEKDAVGDDSPFYEARRVEIGMLRSAKEASSLPRIPAGSEGSFFKEGGSSGYGEQKTYESLG